MLDGFLSSRPANRPYERLIKPAIDAVAAMVLLLLVLPLLLILCLMVRVSLGSGVLFRQRRVGRNGVPFTIYKFRTMRHDRRQHGAGFTGDDRRTCHKRADDPRLTPTGRLLRKLSLDELPQLINVVRGDMSLVGPRPELLEITRTYEPWQHARHAVKPGITGLWQIQGRGTVMMHEATALDLAYVERLSLRTDMAILARTIPSVLLRRGL